MAGEDDRELDALRRIAGTLTASGLHVAESADPDGLPELTITNPWSRAGQEAPQQSRQRRQALVSRLCRGSFCPFLGPRRSLPDKPAGPATSSQEWASQRVSGFVR
jgi:hypothetical protein